MSYVKSSRVKWASQTASSVVHVWYHSVSSNEEPDPYPTQTEGRIRRAWGPARQFRYIYPFISVIKKLPKCPYHLIYTSHINVTAFSCFRFMSPIHYMKTRVFFVLWYLIPLMFSYVMQIHNFNLKIVFVSG